MTAIFVLLGLTMSFIVGYSILQLLKDQDDLSASATESMENLRGLVAKISDERDAIHDEADRAKTRIFALEKEVAFMQTEKFAMADRYEDELGKMDAELCVLTSVKAHLAAVDATLDTLCPSTSIETSRSDRIRSLAQTKKPRAKRGAKKAKKNVK